MADEADSACVHPLGVLRQNNDQRRVEWLCSDCGRVFAWISDESWLPRDHPAEVLEQWAERVGIRNAQRTVTNFLIAESRP